METLTKCSLSVHRTENYITMTSKITECLITCH